MPIKRRTPLITVDLGSNGGSRLFYNLDEVDAFITSESEAAPGRLIRSIVGGPAWQRIAEAQNMVGNARSSPDYLEPLHRSLTLAFGDATPFSFPTSCGPRGKFVTEIAETRGDGVAAGAAAYFINALGNLTQNSETIQGAHLAAAFDIGVDANSAKNYRAAFKAIADQGTRHHRKFAEDSATLLADIEERRDAATARLRRAAVRWVNRQNRRLDEAKERFDIAEKDIRLVEETYKVQMALQAPVEYWEQKKARHRKKAVLHRRVLCAFGIAATVVLGWLLYEVANRIVVEAGKGTGAGAIAYAGIGVFVTTIAFWAARIMVRLFMSEHHLAIDAEERAIMVQTYLALKLKEQVGPEDLKIILTGLFKSTSDGIVKDDGAPEIGIASLFSKAASK
ncbi:DUF6161 domain-containing protein [Bosea sp. (in: a-proteobacteria)]|uniref:DUF6161 domain-containing protein n=1 Tax=Bosea sp. (in: a-proteobacteria) TaxID=1871050 RepID=UPI0025C3414B|nr:DUF6161 domain-containing protein [Bosea sp. (in: a-proteobacteria)]MBR3190447.1 hypothetical protein [Bosea sp. (in: a-proteobacteria)]